MNICYLILAHDAPELLKRSVNRLADTNSYFYIHIDRQADIEPFKEALKSIDNVRFVDNAKRVKAVWGTAEALKGIVACMEAAAQEHADGYTILMSGTDYPLRTKTYIREFITQNADTIFVDATPMPTPFWHQGGIDRISRHWFNLGGRNFVYINPFKLGKRQLKHYITILNTRPSLLPQAIALWFVKRKFPIPNFVHYGGSLWFGAPLFSIKTLLTYLGEHPEYLKFHKRSKMPDEIVFNSLFMMDKQAKIVTDTTLRFIEWDYTKKKQPSTFTIDDKDTLTKALKTKDNLLARKFNLERDTQILDYLDETSLLSHFDE